MGRERRLGRRPKRAILAAATTAWVGAGLALASTGATAAAEPAVATPAPIENLAAITCPNQTTCFAAGSTTTGAGVVLETNTGGLTWWRRDIPSTVGALSAVDCVNPETCVAGGTATDGVHPAIIWTSDGGAIWKVDPQPVDTLGPPVSDVTSIRCQTTWSCVASVVLSGGGGGVASTVHAGESWTANPIGNDAAQNAISCPRPGYCFIVGSASSGSDFVSDIDQGFGVLWGVTLTYPPSAVASGQGWQLNGISCASPSDCVAVGGSSPGPGGAEIDIFSTTNTGTSWVRHDAPSGVTGLPYQGGLTGVVCPRPADCYAVGGADVIDSTNKAWTWGQQKVPAGIDALDAIACPVYFRCYAVGGSSIITTTDSGQHWKLDNTTTIERPLSPAGSAGAATPAPVGS